MDGRQGSTDKAMYPIGNLFTIAGWVLLITNENNPYHIEISSQRTTTFLCCSARTKSPEPLWFWRDIYASKSVSELRAAEVSAITLGLPWLTSYGKSCEILM